MCELIQLINREKLINVLGPPGVGKTSLVRNLCWHLHDRHHFTDGVIHVSLRGCESITMMLIRVSLKIQSDLEKHNMNVEEFSILNTSQDSDSEDSSKDIKEEKLLRSIVKILQEKEVLLILDNSEDTHDNEPEKLSETIDFLLSECWNLKILITARKYLHKLENEKQAPYHLGTLDMQASITLLLKSCPRKITDKEIKELLDYKIPEDSWVHETYTFYSTKSNGNGTLAPKRLTNHPFILMLGGHPQAIQLSASMLEHASMSDLFKRFLDTNLMETLSSCGQRPYASLKVSYDMSISHIQKNNPEALDLFKLLGLLPGSINHDDLTQLWGDDSWQPLQQELIRSSLIICKPMKKKLLILPYMTARVQDLLEEEPEKMKELHLKCCKFYKDALINKLVSVCSSPSLIFCFRMWKKGILILQNSLILSLIYGRAFIEQLTRKESILNLTKNEFMALEE